MNNKDVIYAWLGNKHGKNSKRNLTTNGTSLYSYKMLIGITLDNGQKVMLNLGGDYRITNVTKRHSSVVYNGYTRVNPILNPNKRLVGALSANWVFPTEYLDRAIGSAADKRALDYTDAIITMECNFSF